ncbi:hypothetical protein D3C75_1175890 [compost metagenome]
MVGKPGDDRADQYRNDAGEHRDLVGGDTVVVEALNHGAQQVLKGGLELVDGGHRGEISTGCGAGLIQVRDYDRLRGCWRVFLENECG